MSSRRCTEILLSQVRSISHGSPYGCFLWSIAGEGNLDSGIREILLMGSAIREISLVKSRILGFGIWNPSSTDKDSGIQNPCNSVLDSFTWGNFQSRTVSGVVEGLITTFTANGKLLLPFCRLWSCV